jgi:transcriptional regulator with XRE-family HTH domain
MASIKTRLRLLRAEREWSQARLAAEDGVTRSVLPAYGESELEWTWTRNEATAVPEARTRWRMPRYVVVAIAIVFAAAIAVGATLAIQDRKDEAITEEITRAESDLKELGAQISATKDADLASMNDFIAAYAQVEPLEKEYDQKLQNFTELYRTAKDRDSHTGPCAIFRDCAAGIIRSPGKKCRKSSISSVKSTTS